MVIGNWVLVSRGEPSRDLNFMTPGFVLCQKNGMGFFKSVMDSGTKLWQLRFANNLPGFKISTWHTSAVMVLQGSWTELFWRTIRHLAWGSSTRQLQQIRLERKRERENHLEPKSVPNSRAENSKMGLQFGNGPRICGNHSFGMFTICSLRFNSGIFCPSEFADWVNYDQEFPS